MEEGDRLIELNDTPYIHMHGFELELLGSDAVMVLFRWKRIHGVHRRVAVGTLARPIPTFQAGHLDFLRQCLSRQENQPPAVVAPMVLH